MMGTSMNRRTFLSTAVTGWATRPLLSQSTNRKTRNVLLVTTDGLRWQDVFRGADASLINKKSGGVADPEALRKRFWRDSAVQRREALMPFLWTVLAKQGQLYGNRDLGSDAYVTNGKNFSYPGYNEILTGAADPRIDSNDKVNNPNVNVLEWLNQKESFRGRVGAFGAWDCFPYILNAERSGLLVNAGYEPLKANGNTQIELLNRLKVETRVWDAEPFDAPVFHLALEHLRATKPRVLYLALGETDEWAHDGRYDLYLTAAHRVDQYLKELWNTVQSMPEYRDSTTLIVSVDHGRGSNGETWKSHGEKLPETKYIWFGILGPDTPAMGERSKVMAIQQNQIASTLAAVLGEDYRAAYPKSGAPIAGVLGG